ncbi:MAG: glycosyltransferase family 2 protein [Roseitalea sp.]|jgi:dolichol-phosphate mannosyltransferase|nr:glycosyltransferase family 2 protein [Roseitalea sp.]MBO6721284.1 glycosyltransferase family 2 protein [Roseitalea sp.]MBO6742232.1 glycosyltransferase family 2 protein [Roseitalea sp.]
MDGDPRLPTAAPELTVVLPAYNEAENIPVIVDKIGEALGGVAHEIIVVDDDSPDGTAEVTRSVARTRPHVRCIRRVGRRGLSGACLEGMMAANAPVVVVMDADMQHDETRLPVMLGQIADGADLVIGSRYVEGKKAGGGFHKKSRAKGSELATSLANMITGRYTTDPMSGFFMMRRDVADMVAGTVSREGFKILFDIVSRYGSELDIREVPFEFRERVAGESKLGFLVTVQFLGLLVSRFTGGLIPAQFLLFALVGSSGLLVHLAALYLANSALGIGFVLSQILATYMAMTTNFAFNNEVTFGHRKLTGKRFWAGLLTFYAVCSIGAIGNVAFSERMFEFGAPVWIAGLSGALMSALFNFAVTKLVTWRDA